MASENTSTNDFVFPPPLDSYAQHAPGTPLLQVLKERIVAHPFNLVATCIFFMAIAHTFAAPMFLRISHQLRREHQERLKSRKRGLVADESTDEVSFRAEIFHFLGEVEAVFGIWIIPLLVSLSLVEGWPVARTYLGNRVNFVEPMFVVVIMTIAASRPVLKLAEQVLAWVASLGGGTPGAWWLSILTFGPLLGSFITEPGAMTIAALVLGHRFYRLGPRPALAYATIGCLFVNVSVGGTLTHFAAPPVLMVAGRWGWDLKHMFFNFGLEAALGIVISNVLVFFWFRREFRRLRREQQFEDMAARGVKREYPVPIWIICVHLLFLAWTVFNNHYPALFLGGFLFYLAFVQATEHHQDEVGLRPALLVGFFLAGLVVHGGLQGWWIEPVLTGLNELPLFFGAATLTAFNDNAAITYLASLVPDFTDPLKHAVVAGAVAGGGLTVIANAPNPAGQSILSKYFPDGVSPLRLFLGALVPTVIASAMFLLLR